MTLSFVEAMRGWLRAGTGPDIPVSFEIHAVQRGRGRFEVKGVIAAPPLTRETPARGTLELGLRAIAYHLEFTSTDGRALTLDATKHPTLLSPLRSMTAMHAIVRDAEGTAVASGEMRFNTRDLPGFLRSWVPALGNAHRELDARRRQIERRTLARDGGS